MSLVFFQKEFKYLHCGAVVCFVGIGDNSIDMT